MFCQIIKLLTDFLNSFRLILFFAKIVYFFYPKTGSLYYEVVLILNFGHIGHFNCLRNVLSKVSLLWPNPNAQVPFLVTAAAYV